MKRLFFNIALIIFTIFLVSSSCERDSGSNKIKEGVIEYDIRYIENNMDGFAASLLPKTMYLKFKGHLSVTSIEGMMGAFFVKNITDLKKLQNTTLLKALNNEFFYLGEEKEMPTGYSMYEGITYEYPDDTINLAGFNCKTALATIPGYDKPITIHYTNDINIKNSNALTPYHDIDGVLMQFQIELSLIKMEITAKKFHQCTVPEEEFDIPKGFKRISRKKMEQVINELME